jgi:DnaJ-class molecular chaperone
MKDYYKILNFQSPVKFSEVAKTHTDLTQIYIVNRLRKVQNTEAFELQSEAFYVLKNPTRKVAYDYLHDIKYGLVTNKSPKTTKKWELKISEAAEVGQTYGKALALLSTQQLTDRCSKKENRFWQFRVTDFFENVIEFVWNLAG